MKKLLNIFSSIMIINVSSLSLTSCLSISSIKLTFKQEEEYILKAINANKNEVSKGNNVIASDIMPKPSIIYLEDDSNNLKFVYHLSIYQNKNTFLNLNHRITNLEGTFTLNYDNKTIISNTNKMTKTYSLGTYDNYLENVKDSLIGNSNDFTLIMNINDWNQLVNNAISYHNQKSLINVNKYLQQLGIFNKDIVLEEDGTIDDWLKVVNLVSNKMLINNNDYVYLHIIKPKNKDYEISYNNLLTNSKKNFPKIFSFRDYKKYNDRLSIILSKDLLEEFSDVYNSFLKKENYGLINWNYNSLMFLLERNYYLNNNIQIRKIAKCIMTLFQNNSSQISDAINNISLYSGIEILFNKNIEFLGSKLINVNYENSEIDAVRFIKDHYDFKNLISVSKKFSGYYIEYNDNDGNKQNIYVFYNNQSFNDYQNTKKDALRYFHSLSLDVKYQYFIHSIGTNAWNIQYINNIGISKSIILNYDSVNAIFSLVK